MSPKRLGLLALIYYKSGKDYLADSQSTTEQLAVGYFSQFKGLNVILDVIRSKINLDNAPDWRKLAKKLFKKKDNAIKEEKIEKEDPKSNDGKLQKKSSKLVNKKQKAESTQQSTNIAALESEESSANEDDAKSSSPLPPTTIDDFFITADGSNYLSTAVANQKQEDDSDDDSKGRMKHGKSFVKKSHESSFFQKDNKKTVKLATARSEGGTKRKWSNDKDEQKIITEKHSTVDPNLHPSWQAKQKLKPTIAEFKGKKITFD